MKNRSILYFLLFIVFSFLSCDPGTSNNDEGNPSPSSFILASWNIRILSDASRDDTELQQIADIIKRYDFVAVQEARDTTVLDRLKVMLPGWDYVASTPVGNTITEIYAYYYRTSKISSIGTPYVYGDPNNVFIREPYVAHFDAGAFDFTTITIHTIYGDTIAERRAENALLDDVIENVDIANGSENDVILMGDFNLPADDSAWDMVSHINLVSPSQMTTITDTSSYDNIWIDSTNTGECDRSIEVYAFDDDFIDDDAASLAVSDHRPISTVFTYSSDDDGAGNWDLATGDGGLATLTDGDIRIESVISQPTEDEAVSIKNYSVWPVDISNWSIGDLNDPDSYGIQNGTVIQPGDTITYSSQLNFVINNNGEIIYLKNNGVVKDTWSN